MSQARGEGHPPGARPPPSTPHQWSTDRSAPWAESGFRETQGKWPRRSKTARENTPRQVDGGGEAGRSRCGTLPPQGTEHTHPSSPTEARSSLALLLDLAMPALGGVSCGWARDCLHAWKVVEGPRVARAPAMTALHFCGALSRKGVQKPLARGSHAEGSLWTATDESARMPAAPDTEPPPGAPTQVGRR